MQSHEFGIIRRIFNYGPRNLFFVFLGVDNFHHNLVELATNTLHCTVFKMHCIITIRTIVHSVLNFVRKHLLFSVQDDYCLCNNFDNVHRNYLKYAPNARRHLQLIYSKLKQYEYTIIYHHIVVFLLNTQ